MTSNPTVETATADGQFDMLESRVGTPDDLAKVGLDQAVACWRQWAGANPMPGWRDVRLLDLPTELISGVMVADVVAGPPLDFVVRYWGTALVEAFGFELSGRRVSETEHFGVLDKFLAEAPELLRAGEPQIRIVRLGGRTGVPRDFCSLRLPLASNGVDADSVMTLENVAATLAEPLPWVL